jgi:hypothetical protein
LVAEERKRLADQRRRLREHRVEIDRADEIEQREYAERETEVADAVDDKSLDRGRVRRRLVVPEADQQIAREADALPSEEQLHEVVRGHQHQHREGEQREIAEETRPAGILVHVADGIEVHEAGDRRHDDQHHGGQRVDAQRPVDRQLAGQHPGEYRNAQRLTVEADLHEGDPRQHAGDQQEGGRDQLGQAGARRRRLAHMRMIVLVMQRLVVRVVECRAAMRLRLMRMRSVIGRVVFHPGRRAFAGQEGSCAEQRDQPGQNGAEQRQKDDGQIHGA